MAQIFLSYSRQDADSAKAIASALGDRGHGVWWDKHISGGSKFAAEIEQALSAAEIVIVLWSRAAINSAWVLDEAAEGRDTGRLLPVALDDCKPPLGFRQYQTIAAAGARLEAALDEIIEAIGRRLGDPGDASVAGELPAVIAPGSPEAHCAAARRFEEQGRFEEAWREIEAALASNAQSAEANREAANLHYMQGRPADAVGFYEKAAGASLQDHESASMLISCYRAIEDEASLNHAAAVAVARAEQSIASTRIGGPAFASGAKGLAALGHRERARKWVRKALNMDPGNLHMRYCLASTLVRFLDDSEAAVDMLEPFVEGAFNRIHLQLLECDPDWTAMRDSRDFQTLVSRARKRVEAMEGTSFAGNRGPAR